MKYEYIEPYFHTCDHYIVNGVMLKFHPKPVSPLIVTRVRFLLHAMKLALPLPTLHINEECKSDQCNRYSICINSKDNIICVDKERMSLSTQLMKLFNFATVFKHLLTFYMDLTMTRLELMVGAIERLITAKTFTSHRRGLNP